MMETILSADGTSIAFRQTGSGQPLVLVHGSTADHTRWNNILSDLEEDFTVIAMDRRGRGRSGDAESYEIEQEYKDIAAIARQAGEQIHLLGHSFGALCAMEAALIIDNLSHLILYEPCFPVDEKPLYPPGLPGKLKGILEKGDRENFLITFFKEAAGASDEQIDALRADPSWQARIASAHTALREMVDGEYQFVSERFAQLDAPTLLLTGENSPAELTAPSHVLDATLPNSQIVVMEGQGHVAMTTAPDLFLLLLRGFLVG